jgi:5-methyltetrahydrofolate--homocysteine methyltransferase
LEVQEPFSSKKVLARRRHKMELLDRIAESLELGEEEEVAELTRQAIEEKVPAHEILNDGLLKGMGVVGKLFKAHEIFLPDVLLAARAMHAGTDLLKPLLIEDGIPSKGKVILGTVEGDLHDIGKNLVAIMLRGAGYEVVDLGADVAPAGFIEAAKTENCQVVGMSALLTTTMPMMKEVTGLLKKENNGVKVIIGGAPVSEEYAEKIGADAYAFDASHAVRQVDKLFASQGE